VTRKKPYDPADKFAYQPYDLICHDAQGNRIFLPGELEWRRRHEAARKAVETKGPSDRRRAAKMAAWTRKHGKNDGVNPFSKTNAKTISDRQRPTTNVSAIARELPPLLVL
jgi:hypothetical protein